MDVRSIGCIGATVLAMAAPAQAAPVTMAAFDFEFYDTSAEGEINGARPDEARRTVELADQVRAFVKDRGVALVDIAPAKTDVDAQVLRTCGACVATFAKALGAQYSLMGYVQKVSNLILNINVEIRDAATGEVVRKGSTDIRGNTRETWSHGARSLMRYTILKEPLPAAAP